MSKNGKPLWRVTAEHSKADKSKITRQYHVVAPEMETTPRGTRSNEYNVREVCNEKGFFITSTMFLGFVKQLPANTIDMSSLPEKDEETPKKKFVKKPFQKRK